MRCTHERLRVTGEDASDKTIRGTCVACGREIVASMDDYWAPDMGAHGLSYRVREGDGPDGPAEGRVGALR